MVIPLGLVALAAAAGAKPYYDRWAQGIAGRRAGDVLDQAGGDAEAQAQGFLKAGLISPDQFLGFGQDQADYGLRQQAQQIQQGQFGQQFGLDQQRFGFDVAEAARSRAERMLGGGGGLTQITGPVTGGIMDAMKQAVAGIESGGAENPYAVLGPETAQGRAIGKYQVMPANVASWTKAALGQAMTPEEFRASPEAQEAVFEHRMGGYLDRTGSVEDALSMWHSGRPLSEAMNASDGYMRTADYAKRGAQTFSRLMGVQQYQQQQQQAIRDADLEAEDAAAPLIAARERADTVLEGIGNLGRFGSGVLQSTEGRAELDQMKAAGEALFYDWKNEVYGEAEPSPITLEQLRAAFPRPGDSNWEDRERVARFYEMMSRELELKAEYKRARVLYSKGLMDEATYRSFNGGRLTREERREILEGDIGVPEGFRPRGTVTVGGG